MITTTDLLICHDCACVIANGECVAMTADGYADIAADLIARWQANGWTPSALVLACEADEVSCPDYATQACDACGSDLAGWRHVAAVLEREHRHEYRRDLADWWCHDCQTVTDWCQQTNPH